MPPAAGKGEVVDNGDDITGTGIQRRTGGYCSALLLHTSLTAAHICSSRTLHNSDDIGCATCVSAPPNLSSHCHPDAALQVLTQYHWWSFQLKLSVGFTHRKYLITPEEEKWSLHMLISCRFYNTRTTSCSCQICTLVNFLLSWYIIK